MAYMDERRGQLSTVGENDPFSLSVSPCGTMRTVKVGEYTLHLPYRNGEPGVAYETVKRSLDVVLASAFDLIRRGPRQVIHGDFNPHNLLADPADPSHLTGILDFGDMTLSHRICDLAVAASYLIDPTDPTSLLIPLTQPYHQANPLTAQELHLLPDLITARLVTTLTISAWRAARYPENAPYILRNAPTSRAGLDALTNPGALAETLTKACGTPT